MNGRRNRNECQSSFKGGVCVDLTKNIIVILFVLIGVVSIAYGAYLAWQPLGFIIGGLLLTGFAMTIDEPFKKGGGNK